MKYLVKNVFWFTVNPNVWHPKTPNSAWQPICFASLLKRLDLAQAHGLPEGTGIRIDQALKQTDLASHLGTTRESINQALSHFKKLNLVKVEQGCYTLLDPQALRDMSW